MGGVMRLLLTTQHAVQGAQQGQPSLSKSLHEQQALLQPHTRRALMHAASAAAEQAAGLPRRQLKNAFTPTAATGTAPADLTLVRTAGLYDESSRQNFFLVLVCRTCMMMGNSGKAPLCSSAFNLVSRI